MIVKHFGCKIYNKALYKCIIHSFIHKTFLLTSFQSYVIEKGVCYLVLCEAGFPKKLAFAYLEDLQAEFHEQHGKKVPTVSRPYSFIEFGKSSHSLNNQSLI